MSTQTPRTDAAAYEEEFFGGEVVSADFARELELELRDALILAREGYDQGRKAGEDHGGDNLSA